MILENKGTTQRQWMVQSNLLNRTYKGKIRVLRVLKRLCPGWTGLIWSHAFGFFFMSSTSASTISFTSSCTESQSHTKGMWIWTRWLYYNINMIRRLKCVRNSKELEDGFECSCAGSSSWNLLNCRKGLLSKWWISHSYFFLLSHMRGLL